MLIQKIVSGGQTGADRAALDWAISRGIPHGGWCPKGRRAEDGVIPEFYRLQELGTSEYVHRTEKNVIDSDGTAVFSINPELSGGSRATAEFAMKHGKPLLHVHSGMDEPGEVLAQFVSSHEINTLNVAGPRASEEPEIGLFVWRVLDAAFPRNGVVNSS